MLDSSEARIREALAHIIHPEIEGRNLVELGMIKGISIHDKRVEVTLALPFKEIPIKDDLVHSVEDAIKELSGSLDVQVKIAEMTQKERASFMAYSQGGTPPEEKPHNDITHVVAVMSGKGGVGKSSRSRKKNLSRRAMVKPKRYDENIS